MKEVTYEDWLKNPTPRVMWCWNVDVAYKVQVKVIYVLNHGVYPVITAMDNDVDLLRYKHCAEIEEIEESKRRRMTYKELSRWLREKPTRECKYRTSEYVCSAFEYKECKQDKEVLDDILIRENGGEWREPLVEDHYKD